MSLLQVRNLSRAFGGVQAVDGMDIDVQAGELLALIGPNGAGKSTTFNMINGQLRPSTGTIVLAGQSLVGRSPRQISRLGVGRTFQIAATFASLTVVENVQMALVSHQRRVFALWPLAARLYRDQAMALLAQVGMTQQAERPCSELAYGDIKRVELAMALANEPRLLLMDEPTAGMAAGERLALMALTRDLVRERQMAVLFTEHSMDVVFAFADRVCVLARGRVIAQGTPAEIRADAQVQQVYLGTGRTFERHSAPVSSTAPAPAPESEKGGD
ncbi:MAG: ABC transporter ATP-binding protein, partial [Comamonadaceae bacterium]